MAYDELKLCGIIHIENVEETYPVIGVNFGNGWRADTLVDDLSGIREWRLSAKLNSRRQGSDVTYALDGTNYTTSKWEYLDKFLRFHVQQNNKPFYIVDPHTNITWLASLKEPTLSWAIVSMKLRRGGITLERREVADLTFNIDGSVLVPDNEDPVLTGSVSSTAKTDSTITWTWTAGTDNIGIDHYEINLNGAGWISVGNTTTYQSTGLTQLTSYTPQVRALDASGNISAVITGAAVVTNNAPIDADAQAFVDACLITNPTQIAALDALVSDLKTFSIWTKMHALYPFVGGDANCHKFNLKDPQDTDAAFRLTFSTTGADFNHDANGITGSGQQHANTHYTPSINGTLNSEHVSSYSRSNITGSFVLIGQNGPANAGTLLFPKNNNFLINSQSTGFDTATNPDSLGFFSLSRISSANYRVRNNATSTLKTKASSSLQPFSFYIAARNANGSPGNFASHNIAFTTIGSGLTETEAGNLRTAVNDFQTALGRNVV